MNTITKIFLVLIGLMPTMLFAFTDKIKEPDFQIISDSIDNDVPLGACLVTGIVKSEGLPIAGISIYGFKSVNVGLTDKDGKFTITVDDTELGIYTSHPSFVPNYFENYKFKSGHHIKLVFNIKKPEELNYPREVKKPVIYAYSDASLPFTLQLNTSATISFTYPILKDKWEMTASKNGILTDQSNQTYPYLFWEGEINNLTFQQMENQLFGNIVAKANVVDFLEDVLAKKGLNTKESTDFITFWAPLMQQHESVFVQFLFDDAYNIISTMEINPVPNNLRRVYLLFSDANGMSTTFIPQKMEEDGINRDGFTIIEWGGSDITSLKKL